jgi:multiple sugar transport system permease protein
VNTASAVSAQVNAATAQNPGPGGRGQSRQTDQLGWLLVAPASIVIIVLVLYPTVVSLIGSLQHYSLVDQDRSFVGIKNYLDVLTDTAFQRSAVTTVKYFVAISIGVLVVGLGVALWLQSLKGWVRGLALCVIIIPWAVPGTVSGLLWSFIFTPTGSGLLNSTLTSLHLIGSSQAWLNMPTLGPVLIALTVVWGGSPLGVVIFLAALEGIPRDLYAQSLIDGAGPARQFWSISLPLLRPAIAIVLLNAATLAIGLFDQVYVLAGIDPSKITIAASMYLYAFRDFNFGLGFAAAVISALITTLIAVVYLKGVYREVEY